MGNKIKKYITFHTLLIQKINLCVILRFFDIRIQLLQFQFFPDISRLMVKQCVFLNVLSVNNMLGNTVCCFSTDRD